ncbi:MAG: PilZ domain-containing protein [Candidatus Omnitrophica bacterium]|nr:PilZ domain-containing protein [Candidatus Omnitrophota bacterium]
MWDGFEGRKFPRVHTGCLISIKRLDAVEEKQITARTENIGIGGICVVLDEPLPKFSKIHVELDLSDGGEPLACRARVVWMVESRNLVTSKIAHDTGIEFIGLTEKGEARIKKVIQTHFISSK